MIYVGSWDGNLYSLNRDNGDLIWEFKSSAAIRSSPIVGADGCVYFGSNDHNIYSIDGNTGKKKWAFKTEGQVVSSPVINYDGILYAGSNDGKIYGTGFGISLFTKRVPKKVEHFPEGGRAKIH